MKYILLNLHILLSLPLFAHMHLQGKIDYGFSAILQHQIRYGEQDAMFDYKTDGGQDVLVPFWRFELEGTWGKHQLVLTYQPIFLEGQTRVSKGYQFDDIAFKTKDSIKTKYWFPYYRALYLYGFDLGNCWKLDIGAGLQLRNATIEFANLNGNQLFENRNVGPVPLLGSRIFYHAQPYYAGLEATGFYAWVPILNGSNRFVMGYIYDVALKGGYHFSDWASIYLSLRGIGGGAMGNGPNRQNGGGTYNENWLHTLQASTGFNLFFN